MNELGEFQKRFHLVTIINNIYTSNFMKNSTTFASVSCPPEWW